jgi:hypothetical protein
LQEKLESVGNDNWRNLRFVLALAADVPALFDVVISDVATVLADI